MMKELLLFLERADPEFKEVASSSIVHAAEKFAPSRKWHLDTLLNVLVAVSGFVFMHKIMCHDNVSKLTKYKK